MREPWCWTEEEALRLTHRRAVLLVKSYDPVPDSEAFDARVKAELAENERVFAAKSLEQKKAEYWAFCRDSGCGEADIQRQWDAYLNGKG